MAQLDEREMPRGLSWWPRILALATLALAGGGCFAAWSAGESIAGTLLFMLSPFAVAGAVLARPGEINPRRIVGIWTSLLAYIGSIVGLVLVTAGLGLGLPAPEQRQYLLPDQGPYGAWGAVYGMGMIVLLVCVPAFVLSALCTVAVTRPKDGTMVDLDAAPTGVRTGPAQGREVGAAVAATLTGVAGLGIVLATILLANVHITGTRIGLVWLGGLLATVLVGVGTAAHVRGGRRAPAGLLLLWIGALTLTAGVVLDSLTAIDLSGVVGTAAFSGDMGALRIGVATFLLPAALLALVAALSALPLHIPRLHRPRLPRDRTPQHQT